MFVWLIRHLIEAAPVQVVGSCRYPGVRPTCYSILFPFSFFPNLSRQQKWTSKSRIRADPGYWIQDVTFTCRKKKKKPDHDVDTQVTLIDNVSVSSLNCWILFRDLTNPCLGHTGKPGKWVRTIWRCALLLPSLLLKHPTSRLQLIVEQPRQR